MNEKLRNKITVVPVEEGRPAQLVGLIGGRHEIDLEAREVEPDWGEVQLACVTLAGANELHARGERTLAYAYAVQAARQMFLALGAKRDGIEPLNDLLQSFNDIVERGIADPALNPPTRMKGVPHYEWSARACLAAALEARIRRDEARKVAASAIRSRIRISPSIKVTAWADAEKALIGWRELFKKGKSPIGDVIWKESVALFRSFDALPKTERLARLATAEQRLLDLALKHRSRVLPP